MDARGSAQSIAKAMTLYAALICNVKPGDRDTGHPSDGQTWPTGIDDERW